MTSGNFSRARKDEVTCVLPNSMTSGIELKLPSSTRKLMDVPRESRVRHRKPAIAIIDIAIALLSPSSSLI